MIKNFAYILRGLKKNAFFSSLNILGLTIGMSVFILIALYVEFERSYEAFVPEAASIYRVTLTTYLNDELVKSSAENYPAVGPALKEEYPEVIAYARLYNMGYKNNVIITNEEPLPPVAFKQRKFLYADSAFLLMMGYKLLAGDVETALANPNTAVITRHYAKLYFGEEDPIGKTLRMEDDDNNNELVKVTGVIDEVPVNTHLKFDILFSYKTLFGRYGNENNAAVSRYDQSWYRSDMYTFVQLQDGTNPREISARFPALIDKYKPDLKENNGKNVLKLQPLADIHLTSNLADEAEPNGDGTIVHFLSIIGLFVLVIAFINYVNLATAKAMERAKEVGVQKVMGASRYQLMGQFLLEAALVNLFSLLIAIALVGMVLPAFNSIAGLSLDMSDLLQTWVIAMLILLWVSGTSLSGLYPAFVLSAFKPVTVLKGKLKNSSHGVFFRKALVMFQFMASVALIAGTLIVYRQLEFMMSRNIGMDIDQVIVVERPGKGPYREGFSESIDVFRNELKKHNAIQYVSESATIPGMQRRFKASVKRYGAADDNIVSVMFNSMDYEFMDVFKMSLLAGRAFSEEYPQDPDTSAIITQSTAKVLGFKGAEEAVGQTISLPQFDFNPVVVGVVNDYHQVSLKSPLEPTIFFCDRYGGEYYSIRINSGDLPSTVNHIKASWEKAFPGNPFEYFFLDDYFNRQYENERKFGTLFTVFAGLALVIGCLGLIGLSAYTATQRTKEIGVRKVLGSSVGGIFVLLSREYIKLILLSILLAVPFIYFIMNNWVSGFTYHIELSPLVFVVAGTIVVAVSLLAVSLQTLRAARSNPIESLRYE